MSRFWQLRSDLRAGAVKMASELSREYVRRAGKEEFPRNTDVMMDVANTLFGLDVIFDDQGVLNSHFGEKEKIIGCLFPDEHPSPWGKDKLVAVNVTIPECCREASEDMAEKNRLKRERGESGVYIRFCNCGRFMPTHYNKNHTIAHEVIGHYALHFQKGAQGTQFRKPIYCRNPLANRKPPLEWQADYAAGEFLMPEDKVAWILDGQKPPAVINVDDGLKKRFREYFDASQAMMEIRLVYLGYKLINPVYPWADYTKQEKERQEKIQSKIKARAEARKRQERLEAARAFASIGRKNPFDGIDVFSKAFGGFDNVFTGFFGGGAKRKI